MGRRVVEFAFFWALVLCASGLSTAKGVTNPDYATVTSSNTLTYVPNEIIVKLRPGAADNINKQSSGNTALKDFWPASLQQLNKKYKHIKTQPLVPGFVRNQQRIKDLAEKKPSQLNSREKRIMARAKRAPRGVAVPNLGNIYKIRFDLDSNDSLQEIVENYRKDPAVEYAELNYIVSGLSVPNDSYYTVQWALNNAGQPYPIPGGLTASGTPGDDIDAQHAWNIYTGSSDIVVAVVDTGVDYTHRDLVRKMWTDTDGHYGYDFVNDDSDPMDDAGHGTHCSGIITADTNNKQDIAGVCWNAKIMAVKFLDRTGSGTESDAVSSIYYAVNNGADVISNSWGSPSYSQSLEEAIDYAYSQGVIVVAAAGNNNSSSPFYPAYYNHVISVAATDSHDQKASFSNYGEWVVLAAPGVDILSLRAKNTDLYVGSIGYHFGDRFVPFGDKNATMYIASGTSMACPQVAGACALLLSANPNLTTIEVNSILADTVDPIPDGICFSDGRLNLFRALTTAIHSKSKGHVALDSDLYNCNSKVSVFLADGDLAGKRTHSVSVTTSGGDAETLILAEKYPPVGAFAGTINTAGSNVNIGDGILQVTNGDIISVIYNDANDGTGNPAVVTDTATTDCAPPVVSDIQTDIKAPKLIVTFNSNEPASGKISCGLTCGGPYNLEGDYPGLQTSHTIELSPLLPSTTYYFVVTATDAAGNQVIDSNSGNCYSFTTAEPKDTHVPGEFAMIQEAVDRTWPGSTVWVANGIYTGPGNHDIDFQGKTITVRSENGPANCIINCQGNSVEPHRGFSFHTGETLDAILDSFTITNGFGLPEIINAETSSPVLVGGGIFCKTASPTIKNCIITDNRGDWGGGGIGCYADSYPHISDCIISDNYASIGGGIACELSDPVITNCILTGNQNLGGLYCAEASPIVRNCLFAGNISNEGGGAVRCIGFAGPSGADGRPCNPSFFNCTFTGNSARLYGGGIYSYRNSHATATDCIFWGNTAGTNGHEIYLADRNFIPCSMSVSYCDIQSAAGGIYLESGCTLNYVLGNIDADPRFAACFQGDYYLSQIAACQTVNSPCVDAGSDTSQNLGMDLKTMRTDQIGDSGIVDIGYHYSVMLNPDLNGNAFVNFIDFSLFGDDWQKSTGSCDPNNGDIIKNGQVDIYDFAVLAEQWLVCFVTKATAFEPHEHDIVTNEYVILQWKPGKKSASHDIYFGTDFNDVNIAGITSSGVYMGNQDANFWDTSNYDSDGLDFNTTYYWRIDEVGSCCKTKGNVYAFTIGSKKASDPWPSDGMINVSTHPILSWSSVTDAVSHDVYFGTDINEVNYADSNSGPDIYMGNQNVNYWDTNSYAPAGLNFNTTYYWRIDEVEDMSTTKGDIWRFVTEGF